MHNSSTPVRKLNKKIIAHVRPLRLENWLVLVLDQKWESLIDGELIFEASIADGHIEIRSTKEVKQND